MLKKSFKYLRRFTRWLTFRWTCVK